MCTPVHNAKWPLVYTAIPYWDRLPCVPSNKTPAPVVIISLDEVERMRKEVEPNGQCSIHLACQRNAPLSIIRLLVESCKDVLDQVDDDGNLPLMIGEQFLVRVNWR